MTKTKQSVKLTLAETALFGILGALTFGAKFVMSPLPNIEPVSLFVMLFAVTFGKKALFPIYVYVVMEFLVFGIGIWNVFYLYVWLVLFVVVLLLRKMTHPVGWALVSGVFGLFFGFLCALAHLVSGGPAFAVSWWVSGIPYDLLHCAGNFVIALVLFVPLRKVLGKLYEQMKKQL